MKKHQKKRNVGLLYEFLTRHAAEGMVDGDDARVRRSIRLLRRHFKEGTELQREFRLFHALMNTCVDSQDMASRILLAAKEASRHYDSEALDREKSLLIRGINHTFDDDGFYDKRVDEYRTYATVQVLLNEWRKPRPDDIAGVARYEDELVQHLLRPKANNVLDEHRDDRVDDLVVGLMFKRVDGKYRGLLNDEQLGLLTCYAGSLRSGDDLALRGMLKEQRDATLRAIDSYAGGGPNDAGTIRRLAEVRGLAAAEPDAIDDRVIAQHLRLARLRQEILGG